jgi:hypothetical protein
MQDVKENEATLKAEAEQEPQTSESSHLKKHVEIQARQHLPERKKMEETTEAMGDEHKVVDADEDQDAKDDSHGDVKKIGAAERENDGQQGDEKASDDAHEDVEEGSQEKKNRSMYTYTPLNVEQKEMRFLVLKAHPNGSGSVSNPDIVECSFSFSPLEACEPYTYVVNTRGNPLDWLPISIDGRIIWSTRNIAVFLNHIVSRESSQRLWFRDICLDSKNPDEKSRYWNPAWMETMMSHSSNIVDLSELMGQLWDQGKLPQPFSSRPKDWLHAREPKPTKHHPSTLELQVAPRGTRLAHKYLPLDYVLDEIRLICLLPAAHHSDPLEALVAYKVLHDETTYHGLSYTWGTEEASCPIYLNNQTFFIRKNLDIFLRAVRFPESRFVIWVDAVCIDQNNMLERNRQLSRMLQIYEGADRVLSWLGEADVASDMAFDFLVGFGKPPVIRHKANGDYDVADVETFPHQLAALYRLLLRPYFRRVWVIQEFSKATTPMMFCGQKVVDADALDKAAQHLLDILHSDSSMPRKMMEADPDLKSVSFRDMSFVRRLFYIRHIQARGKESMSLYEFNTDFLEIGEHSPGILDLVVMARDFEATSPYDKVFAVWNLANDTENMKFKMDYTRSLSDTWFDFAITVAKGNGRLDIICAAEPVVGRDLDIPSWCPDWSTPSTVSSLIRLEEIPNVMMYIVKNRGGPVYHAAGKGDLKPRFEFDGRTLKCAGIIADRVRVVGPYEPDLSNRKDYTEWLNIVCNEFAVENEDDSNMSQNETLSAFWSMLAGDVSGVWGMEESSPTNLPDGTSSTVFHNVCFKPEECRLRLNNTTLDVHSIVTRGRRLIVSENGLMGLAPHYVEIGQCLAVLNGCSVPVLLHENEDGTYRFVGSCFVQGWMEGEALNDYGETLDEAWEAFDLSGRLTIV